MIGATERCASLVMEVEDELNSEILHCRVVGHVEPSEPATRLYPGYEGGFRVDLVTVEKIEVLDPEDGETLCWREPTDRDHGRAVELLDPEAVRLAARRIR